MSCLHVCDGRSPASTAAPATVAPICPGRAVVLSWKLLTSPPELGLPRAPRFRLPCWVPQTLEAAPREPGVHPGTALRGPTVPQGAGHGLCPAGACSGTLVAQLLRLGTVPILEESPLTPLIPRLTSVVSDVTTNGPRSRATHRGPSAGLFCSWEQSCPDLTPEGVPAIPPPPSPGGQPALTQRPLSSLLHQATPLLVPPGQRALGEGTATDALCPGPSDLAQNTAGQTSWRRPTIALTTTLLFQQ